MNTNKYLMALAMVALTACEMEPPAPTARENEIQKAATAANSIHFTQNAEIENIKRRLELTADPGLLGFVILLNETGQPVMYTSVRGKITSGGKRLTPVDRTGGYSDHPYVRSAASDEGTYGQSGEYVYFWTQDGQYIQWNGKYLYSDKPFRMSIQPL